MEQLRYPGFRRLHSQRLRDASYEHTLIDSSVSDRILSDKSVTFNNFISRISDLGTNRYPSPSFHRVNGVAHPGYSR